MCIRDRKKEDACHQKILDQLEEILIRFRENKFDDLLKAENHAELEKLNDQLEAIGHHIHLLREEALEEKESTKEMVSDISHQLKIPVAALDTCFSVLMQNDLSATEQEEFRIRCRSALDGLETLWMISPIYCSARVGIPSWAALANSRLSTSS